MHLNKPCFFTFMKSAPDRPPERCSVGRVFKKYGCMPVIRIKSNWLTGCCMLAVMTLFASCKSSAFYSAALKFPAEDLREDYRVLRTILEKQHPALYWYTPKDSMDLFFDQYYQVITDSMTRQDFGTRVLAPLTAKIRCGHTSVSYPSRYNRMQRKVPLPSFPLHIRVFPPQSAGETDTMAVLSNLNRKDAVLKKGTIITGINGLNARQLTDTFFRLMPTDGYSNGISYIRLSMAFPQYHRAIFGVSQKYNIGYIDSTGQPRQITIPFFNPGDSTQREEQRELVKERRNLEKGKKQKRKSRKALVRSFELDTVHHMGVMNINSFGDGGHLRSFYRKSFRTLRKNSIPNLVIDLRMNGGGRVDNYAALARYIKTEPFKVADSVIAVTNWLGREKKYYHAGFINSLVLYFGSRKGKGGEYHFRYWERKTYRPRTRNHYTGNVFVLIAGSTFSASTLFANAVKGQENVLLVGEEAGGGWHGNTGMLIPNVVLPNSKMKVRIPLHRIVQYKHVPKNGRGVPPDILVPATVENLKNDIDGKMQKALELAEQTGRSR